MRVVIGQSARRYLSPESSKPLVLGGLIVPDHEGLMDVSDGDVLLQSLCHAIGAIKGYQNYIQISNDLFEKDGITDSVVLLERCLNFGKQIKINQVSFSIEVKKPAIDQFIEKMQENISRMLKISKDRVAISIFETGGLTDVSCGDGISVLCALTIGD